MLPRTFQETADIWIRHLLTSWPLFLFHGHSLHSRATHQSQKILPFIQPGLSLHFGKLFFPVGPMESFSTPFGQRTTAFYPHLLWLLGRHAVLCLGVAKHHFHIGGRSVPSRGIAMVHNLIHPGRANGHEVSFANKIIPIYMFLF